MSPNSVLQAPSACACHMPHQDPVLCPHGQAIMLPSNDDVGVPDNKAFYHSCAALEVQVCHCAATKQWILVTVQQPFDRSLSLCRLTR